MYERVTLEWRHGEEAICPVCHHRNACLHVTNLGTVTFYECRDCHEIYAHDHENERALRITRTLGRRCTDCRRFYDTRVDLKWGERFGRQQQILECARCGNTEGY